jgi:hypothetical protein
MTIMSLLLIIYFDGNINKSINLCLSVKLDSLSCSFTSKCLLTKCTTGLRNIFILNTTKTQPLILLVLCYIFTWQHLITLKLSLSFSVVHTPRSYWCLQWLVQIQNDNTRVYVQAEVCLTGRAGCLGSPYNPKVIYLVDYTLTF